MIPNHQDRTDGTSSADHNVNLKGKRVLVTGGTGFVGSHLAERLIREGCKVRVLGNYKSQPSLGNLACVGSDVVAEMEIVWGDVCDRDSVCRVTDGVDLVFHLAALIGIPYSYLAPVSYVRTNVEGTLNVLQAARSAGVERLVHTSTSEVYGSAQYVPMDERHPLVGQSPYSASKIGADKLAESFARSFELPVVTVRPFNVFGPRQSDRAIIPTVIGQCVTGYGPVRIGDPSPKRDFTYVTDTVDGYVRAACLGDAVGRTINLGNGQSISIGDLVARVCELAGGSERRSSPTGVVKSGQPFISDQVRHRPNGSEVSELRCDSTLAKDLLGWQPKVTLDQGLQRTIEFVRAHPDRFSPRTYGV